MRSETIMNLEAGSVRRPKVPPRPEKFANPAIDRIRELGLKKAGWKGEGSVPATRAARDEAITLMRGIIAEKVPIPFIGLDADGAFTFYWKTDDMVVDLGLYGDGAYSYFGRKADKEILSDASRISNGLDAELIEMLRA